MFSENNLCRIYERYMDKQEHVIKCKVMLRILKELKEQIVYEHIIGSDLLQPKCLQVYENVSLYKV